MRQAFCPGHLTCAFQPFRTADPLESGSRGIGVRLGLGARARAEERDDGEVRIVIDGVPSKAPVTRAAVEGVSGGRGFDIEIRNGLPVSQGFGMSAAGAIAASLCVADIVGASAEEAFRAAHSADVLCGGGLGDVDAIASGFAVPVRMSPGFSGSVADAGIRMRGLSLAVLGPKMVTGSVLSDPQVSERIARAGSAAIEEFMSDPSEEKLYSCSARFSLDAGLESPEISDALSRLRGEGYRAGMCMLGNSVFTDAPEREARRILGRRAEIRCCRPYSGGFARRG
jgi:pantoate kinase